MIQFDNSWHCTHPLLVISRQPSPTPTTAVNAHTNASYSDVNIPTQYLTNPDPVAARPPHPVPPPAHTVEDKYPRVDSGDYSLVDDT